MKQSMCALAIILLTAISLGGICHGEAFDPILHQKAYDYHDFVMEWQSSGLGGVTDILFTDDTYSEIYRTWGGGDSTDWTATYLVAQSIRYKITGEQEARDEVIRIAEYLHIVHDITGDPGYLARYAGPNQPPWNVEHGECESCYVGEGEYANDFWIGHQSRDKYMHWYWGLTWAYLTVDDVDMRRTIEEDFVEVLQTLIDNNWTIIDPWGDTWPAKEIGPDLRLSFLLQTAVVTGDQTWWDELDAEYERSKDVLWVTTIAFFNKYMDYYAFINSQAVMQPIFMLWPDRERLEHLFDIWYQNNRQWQEHTHNTFFDAVYFGACNRLGGCPQDELDYAKTDAIKSLTDMYDAPNYQRAKTCPDLPLDPFSVWVDQILTNYPWLADLVNIHSQTAEPHEILDRCWTSTLWEVSPYHTECTMDDNAAHVTHGMDYQIGYWLSVYYGMIPGDGPYGDDDLVEPDDDDDDNDDDDDDDDDNNDDDNDDDDNDDDDNDDDDTGGGSGDDDDDDGCGC